MLFYHRATTQPVNTDYRHKLYLETHVHLICNCIVKADVTRFFRFICMPISRGTVHSNMLNVTGAGLQSLTHNL